MGLAVMMGVQTPAMAAETSQESTTQETVLEPQTEEGETVQVEIAESQAEEIETTQVENAESQAEKIETTQVESAESQTEEAETEQTDITEPQTEEVNATEPQTEETVISTENAESQVEETSGQVEQETEAEIVVLEAAEEDGWHQNDDGSRYYVKDGEVLKGCIEKIGDSYYAFDIDGNLYPEGSVAIGGSSGDEYYLIKADGSLYVNEWYKTEWGTRYYYGEGGKACSGLQIIEGKQYYFSEWGGLYTDTIVAAEDGKYYFCDEDGVAIERTLVNNAWTEVDGKYYYVKDGTLLRNCIEKIGDFYYGFKSNGAMYADEYFSCWNEENQISDFYRAKADGKLYCSEWYQDENKNWYYYKEDASMARGTTKIGETTYYFDVDGVLKANGAVEVGTSYRLADENGSWIQTPGWVSVSGDWYYVLDDGTLYTGILKDNGAIYYLSPKMAKNVGLLDVDGVAYQIAENGLATKAADGFYTGDVLNHLYYVSDGRIATKGWLNVDGNWYYFEEKDYLGIYYAVAGTNETIDGKLYHFNSDGTMASQGWGLYEDGSWYYAFASGELATGDVTIGSTTYHFDENGKTQRGLVVENGICKLYSEDGTLLETGNSDGWSLLGGNYYYLRDGVILKSWGYKLPDGNWYGFDTTGKMRVNTIENGRYYGATGAAQTGWFTVAGKWYYASSVNALLQKGLHVINGAEYYFDRNGTMQTGEFVVNGKLFTTNENGVVLSKTTMKNGWTNCQGSWYYYQNGIAYTGFVGAYYVIDGKMVSNRIVEWKGKRYYVGEDGKYLVNTWCNDGYSYATEDGSLVCSEWKTIDGKQYYFYWEGVLYPYFYYGKGVYTKEGAYLSPDGYAQGWQLIDGIYYYKEGNQFIRNQSKKIKGDWYLFDAHGNMVTGFSSPEIIGYDTYTYDDAKFYYGADGKRVNYTGWQKIDGNWYYFNSKSEAVDGWNIINGTKYYFGKTNHFMYTGYNVISGDLYYFNASGACQGVDNTFTGWHHQDGKWYYIKNGQVTTGTIYVNGTLHEFDTNGVWIDD